MVRKFTDREKEHIRGKLLENGKRLFGSLGLKKTSIEDLTKAAGIAQGTFYLFFRSKEELYFEVLELEEERVRSALLAEFADGPLTKEKFRRFLRHSLEIVESNPLFRNVYEEDTLELLLRKLPPETLERHLAKDSDVSLPLILRWQEEGRMAKLDPELVVGVIRGLVLLALQKKMIGEHVYRQTMDLYIRFVADGLMKQGGDRDD